MSKTNIVESKVGLGGSDAPQGALVWLSDLLAIVGIVAAVALIVTAVS